MLLAISHGIDIEPKGSAPKFVLSLSGWSLVVPSVS